VLNISMAEVSLQGPCIDAIVGEFEAAGVPQHVRVSLDLKAHCIGCPLKHSGNAIEIPSQAA
jgi:hypothetical protein